MDAGLFRWVAGQREKVDRQPQLARRAPSRAARALRGGGSVQVLAAHTASMIGRTLRKWKQNWRFLLKTTVAQALATCFALTMMPRYTTPFMATVPYVPPPAPAPVQILCWPLLNTFDSVSGGDFDFRDVGFAPLVLAWNAFLWAAVLLELKQVLVRAATRRRCTER